MGSRAIGLLKPGVLMRLGRVSNLPTVWSNLLAGMTLAGGNLHLLPPMLLAASAVYVSGMFLNDAFDRSFDAQHRPERPIPSGQVSALQVFIAGFSLMAVALVLVLPLGAHSVATLLLLCGFVLWYDFDHKHNLFAPLIMGICRALLYLLAATAGAITVLPAAAAALGYVAGLTYVAKREHLFEFANLWPLALFAPALIYVAVGASFESAPFLLAFFGWTGLALSKLLFARRSDIRHAVGALIAGISLFDAALISEAGRIDLALVAAGCFALTLLLHRRVPGT